MEKVQKSHSILLGTERDVLEARRLAREWATELSFNLVDQTKIVTATSELARNTVTHGRGGKVVLEMVENGVRRGLRLAFSDQGPGIADINMALKDGFSTRGGLGLGLGGSRRLMNDFQIASKVGEGTTVTVTKWI